MTEPTHRLVEDFTTSFPFDRRLYDYDISGSVAHCRMLAKQKIITRAEAQRIVNALEQIRRELADGSFRALPSDEDIHMAVERRLIERIGAVGGKLHTARSRNDQVALDLRLFLRAETDNVINALKALQRAFAQLAKRNRSLAMPGYTHLQPAQPVLLAHHLLAYAQMLRRDVERFQDLRKRVDVLPLGSGALAGTTFPIDRAFVARQLGFKRISENSMDAVGDRDFAVEFLAAAAIVGMHLSRFAEDLILWASQEFHFVDLPDAFATGSSIMPQKKNPDVAELARGKSGRLYGNLMALLTTLKGLPLTYNRDLQEDKEPVFDSVDTLMAVLQVFTAMLPELRFNSHRLAEAARSGFTLATELADYLATKGVPFRDAHAVVGAVVRYCLQQKIPLEVVPLSTLRRYSRRFEADVISWLSTAAAIDRRRAIGGTARSNIDRQLRSFGV
ncbi:MAG TPA: argininosuccinate lyase [Candidatus Acidoferrales bacterium]|nr:argininosuccinate lyase [Candidatus Acidoferrales bacterium]